MIISVGYRVKSMIAIRFRIWATQRLKEYIIKGFAMDDERLKNPQIEELNRIVTMWLDFAEDQAKRRKQVFMKHWEQKLDDFLRFNERRVLPDAGKVSKQAAEFHARAEYEKFEVRRREYKELVGEADYVKQLENAARQLPENKKGK